MMFSLPFVLALDLETTGLCYETNEITQIGAILLDNRFKQISSFASYVCPEHPETGVSKDFDVYKYTGISRAMLAKERLFYAVIKEFEAWLLSHISSFLPTEYKHWRMLYDAVLFGQNITFDYTMLKASYTRASLSFPFQHNTINLESLFASYYFTKFGKLPAELRLKNICEFAGVSNGKPHDALADIEATVDCARVFLGV